MSVEDAHRDATWVLTVVGGLALTKALEGVLPALEFSQWTDQNLGLICRFFTFLVISIRFFIGASIFFNRVHIEPSHAEFPKRNYILDFASSTVLFSLLYLMALYIPEVPKDAAFLHQRFFIALCAVLLFDWIWYAFSYAFDTREKIFNWAFVNTIAAGFSLVLYASFHEQMIARDNFEIYLAIAILVFSFPDSIRVSRGALPGD